MPSYSFDSFNRANGPVGNAESGGPWTASGAASTWAVALKQLTGRSNSGYEGLLTVNDGQPDGAVQATFLGGTSAGVIFRYTSTTDYWVLTFGANNYIRLSYANNGYNLKADPGAVASVGDVFRIELAGPAIVVYRNNKQTISITDTTSMSATSFGFLTAGSGSSTFADFSHFAMANTPPSPPPAPTATVHRYFNIGGVAVPVS
jgi:hypothetical protein